MDMNDAIGALWLVVVGCAMWSGLVAVVRIGLGGEGQGGGGGGSIAEPGPIAAVGEKVHTRKDTPVENSKKNRAAKRES